MTGVADFSDALLRSMLRASPDVAAELGVDRVAGEALPRDTLPDYSDRGIDARRRVMRDAARAFAQIAAPAAGEDEVTFRMLDYLLDEGLFGPFAGVNAHAFPENPYPLNHLNGGHPALMMLLTRDQALESSADRDAFLARLEQLPRALDGVLDACDARLGEGIVPPHGSTQNALAAMRSFAASPPAENLLMTSARARCGDGSDVLRRVERCIERTILPAYRRAIERLDAIAARAVEDVGLWATPNGEAHYAWRLRAHTTTSSTPADVHALGLDETARTQSALEGAFAEIGVTGRDLAEKFERFEASCGGAFSSDRAAALAQATDLVRDLEQRAGPLFRTAPKRAVEVVPIAASFENSLHHHYTPPSADGKRLGRFSVNVARLLGSARAPIAVICAHEAVPGHHTQLAIAQALTHLPALRRSVVFDAYIEGWAKYAESLLDRELTDDPTIRVARLRGELFSSVNLAVDTGLHALRWTRAQAHRFFRANTGVDAEFADAIVDRSLATPGQLCAYKIGMLTMLRLRDALRASAGAKFDVRDFHDAVLRHGALPLKLLERVALSAA